MDETRDAESDAGENPYAPPPILDVADEYSRPFQWWYWGILVGLLVVSFGVIFVLPPLGIVGVTSTCFAMIRSQLQVVRINRDKLTAVTQSISAEPLVYLFSSVALGVLTSIASFISFFAICIPTGILGLTLSESSSNMELGSIIFIAAVVFGLVVAIWLGIFILRRSLR